MIIVLFLIISCAIILFVLSLEWYYCLVIMIFQIFEILVLNYETKIIIDRGLINQKPNMLTETLKRTFSRISFFIILSLFVKAVFWLLSYQILLEEK